MTAPTGGNKARPGIFPVDSPAPGWLGRDVVGGRITWTGCAGFILEFGGERICFDPFVSNPTLGRVLFGPARSDVALVRATFGDVAAAFIGHTHFDHAMDVAALARGNRDTVVYGSRTTAEVCRRQGLPEEQIHPVADGSRVTVGPFTVETIASRHGTVPVTGRFDRVNLTGPGVPRSPLRWPRGDVFAYRVEFAGVSIHIQTSAGIDDAALARQSHADVLIACLAARHDTPHYFDRLGAALTPDVLIPCHHDNFLRPVRDAPRPVPQLRWDEFLTDIDRLPDTRLVQLPRRIAVEL